MLDFIKSAQKSDLNFDKQFHIDIQNLFFGFQIRSKIQHKFLDKIQYRYEKIFSLDFQSAQKSNIHS